MSWQIKENYVIKIFLSQKLFILRIYNTYRVLLIGNLIVNVENVANSSIQGNTVKWINFQEVLLRAKNVAVIRCLFAAM